MIKKNELLFYIIIFFIFSFIGWIWEIIFELIKNGNIINSGVLFGPWLPIYGSGALSIYMILERFKHKKTYVFIGSFVICTTIEYLTSLYLETKYGLTWWNYSNKPFNINGRVCLGYSLLFSTAGYIFTYKLIPILKKNYYKGNYRRLLAFNLFLILIFLIDLNHSSKNPHIVKKYKFDQIIKINKNHSN